MNFRNRISALAAVTLVAGLALLADHREHIEQAHLYQEMGRLALELETALSASASPQQVELLQDGFDRLSRLWAAAKSGLF